MKRETTNGLPEYTFKYTLDGYPIRHSIRAVNLCEAMKSLPGAAIELQFKGRK